MKTPYNHPNFDLYYRAVCSRDARFDGLFFTAVTSTGIYCRPICPARTPHAKNVRFYSRAMAAEADGFRACRRCRPETSPGSPGWNIRADLVARALRLIDDGVVDAEGVAGLARRLAVSERHLHREMTAQLGTGALALARNRRVRIAKLLINQTQLSLTTIAITAGFASIRQFNATMREVFHCSPSELRRSAQPQETTDGRLTLRLSYRPPFDIQDIFAYLGQRAILGVEEVIGQRYRRTIAFAHSKGMLEVEPVAKKHMFTIYLTLDNLGDLSQIVQRCRNLLDLDADPAAINTTLSEDPFMAQLVAKHPGLRIPGTINGFEHAVHTIFTQQYSLERTRALTGQLAKACGDPLPDAQGTLTHFFPTPEQILQADLAALEFPYATSLKALAQAVVEEDITLGPGADREQTAAQLLKLPEVGPWAAACIAMRALGDPDAFPRSDQSLPQAFVRQGLRADPDAIMQHAEAWRPWRAYATHHLWATL